MNQTWEPEFNAMAPRQEDLAVRFCAEIAGRQPDPVRLLEMAEELYRAERDYAIEVGDISA